MRRRQLIVSMVFTMCACSSGREIDLIYASGSGDISKIVELISKGAKIDCIGLDGLTPLIYAIKKDRTEAIRVLLESGANPDFGSGDLGPLFFAFYYGRKDAAVLLMAKRARLSVPSVVSARFRESVTVHARDLEFRALLAKAQYKL